MEINRAWAMPNKNTFSIKPINELIQRYRNDPSAISIDPFANTNRLARFCNDLDPQYETDFCMDALDFLKLILRTAQDRLASVTSRLI